MTIYIIGIGGVTCGGKTTVTNKLKAAFTNVDIISLDNYFWDEGSPKHVYLPEFDYENWDIPSSLDFERLVRDVVAWKEKHDKSQQDHILLIEGFLIYANSQLLKFFDLKVFITLTQDQCWERRKVRDYLPPEPPGYFRSVAWPCYQDHLKAMKPVKDIKYLDGSNTLEEIYKFIYCLIKELLDH